MISAPVVRFFLAWCAWLLLCPNMGWGQWALDLGYGEQGLVAVGSDTVTIPQAWLRLPGDSVLLLSSTGPANATVIDRDLLLVKLGPDGSRDPSFGNGGTLRFDFEGLDYSTGSDLVEDADGSWLILGSGHRKDSSEHVVGMVARISRSGQVVPLTQNQFQLRLESMGYKEYPNAMAALPGGGFMVVGSSLDPQGWHNQPIAMRLDDQFEPDSSFAGTGKLLFDLDGGQPLKRNDLLHFSGGYFKDLAVLPDGRVTVVGGISNGLHLEGLLVQLGVSGSVDPPFNGGLGHARFNWNSGYDTRLSHLVQLADGTILLGGSAGADLPERGLLVGRFNPVNGSHAHETIDVGGNGELNDLVWDAGGQAMLLVGTARSDSGRNPVLVWLEDIEQMEVHETLQVDAGELGIAEGKLGLVQQSGRLLLAGTERKTTLRSSSLARGFQRNQVAVQEIQGEASDFKLYPNPVSERLTISSSRSLGSIRIYNAEGQQVFQHEKTRTEVVELDLGHLAKGMHLLQVGQEMSRRFVVQN